MAATLNLPTIVVRMMLNANQYLNAMNRVQTANNQLQHQTATRAVALNVARNIVAPLALIGTVAVREFARFDRAMTESLSIMGSVAPEMRKQMEDLAISLSTTTSTSAEDLARSYYFLAQSGLKVNEVMSALPIVNSFAIAGMFDQKKATDILTDAQAALGLNIANNAAANASNMTYLGDILIKSSTIANSSVEQFSTALTSKAGAALKFFKIPVEEGMAALAAFADQGIRAELAGNSMDRALRLLAKSALSNGHVWKMLNFEIYDANGNWKALPEVVENLERVMAGLSAEQRAATLAMMGFDARSQQAITPLIGMSDAMKGYVAELKNANGTMNEVATAVESSFWKQMNRAWNVIVAVAIEIGERLAPILAVLVTWLQSAANAWLSLGSAAQTISIIVAAMAAMAVTLAALIPYLTAMGAALAAWTFAFNPLLVAILGTVAAVAALAAAIVLLPMAIVSMTKEWSGLNAALEEQTRLNDKIIQQQQQMMNKEVKKAQDIEDPKARLAELESQLETAKKNRAGAGAAWQGARTAADTQREGRSNTRVLQGMWMGDEEQAALDQDVAEAEKKKQMLDDHIKRLEEEKKKTEAQLGIGADTRQNSVKMMEQAGILKPGEAEKMSGQELLEAIEKWEKSMGKTTPAFDSIKKALEHTGASIVDGVKGAVQFGEDAADVVNREMERIKKTKEIDEKMAANARDEQERRDNLYANNYNQTKGTLGPARSARDVFRNDIMGTLPDVIRNKQIGLPGFMNQKDNPEIRQARKEEKERRDKFDREKEQLEIQKQQLTALQTIAGNSQTNNVVGTVGKFAKGLLGL